MSFNNRSSNRISRRIPVRFGLEKPTSMGFIKNLSMNGMAISSRVIFEPPAKVNMLIEHKNQYIDLMGQVRWATDRRELQNRLINDGMIYLDMGIQLLERPEKYLELLVDVMEEFSEARKEPRFDIVLRVTLESPEEVYHEYTHNISHGGMYIATGNPPALNTEIEVQIFLGSRPEIIKTRARVVHIVNHEMAEKIGFAPGIGIQFTGFIGDSEKRFGEFIGDLKKKFEAA